MPLHPPNARRHLFRIVPTVAATLVLLLPGGCAPPRPGAGGPPSSTAGPAPAPGTSGTTTTPTRPPSPTGRWQWLPAAPLPAGTYRSIWTGREMILYEPNVDDPTGSGRPVGSVAAAYTPTTGKWRVLPSSGLPVTLTEGGWHPVWDGSEMLTWGLMNGAFNPVTNRWRPLRPSPVYGASITVWTGSQVLMWGGGCCGGANADGAAYTPATDSWQVMPRGPLSGRYTAGAWTGTELVIVGGWRPEENGVLADAAAYNPTTRTWRSLPPLPQPRADATVTWTGSEVLVVGGHPSGFPTGYADGLAYNPITNRWRQMSTMDSTRTGHVAVWTGTQLLVWGGATAQGLAPDHGEAYDPATDTWTALPVSVLRGRTEANAVWTGRALLIWGGVTVVDPHGCVDGAAYTPTP